MMGALQKLGASFEWKNGGDIVVVTGIAGNLSPISAGDELYISNAGTASRFLTSTLTLVKGPSAEPIVLTGCSRMKERPVGPLVDALCAHGCKLEYLETEGCLPIRVHGTGLKPGKFFLEGKVSSQFVSSVLLSAPLADGVLELVLAEEHPTSLPYILMTIAVMKEFGSTVQQMAENHFVIEQVRRDCLVRLLVYRRMQTGYKNPSKFMVEADASSATYPLAMAAITGGEVTVEGITSKSLQGDAQFCKLLERMGCEVIQTQESTTVKGTGTLRAVDANMETMTDAFMTACAVAVAAEGTTNITGVYQFHHPFRGRYRKLIRLL
jgi:pentafunctional AROM polypeptide